MERKTNIVLGKLTIEQNISRRDANGIMFSLDKPPLLAFMCFAVNLSLPKGNIKLLAQSFSIFLNSRQTEIRGMILKS